MQVQESLSDYGKSNDDDGYKAEREPAQSEVQYQSCQISFSLSIQ